MKQKIKADLKSAMKTKRELEISVLRMVLADILNKEKEKRYKIGKQNSGLEEKELEERSQLTDEEIIEVLSSEAKKRKDSIEQFEKGGRHDLAEKEKQEIEILKKYLPEQLPKSEIKKLAEEVIKEIDAKEIKDMGKVMAQLMPKLKGRADGSTVGQVVKQLLTQNNFTM